VKLFKFIRDRRQRRARKRYEREKAIREAAQREDAIDRVARDMGGFGGGIGVLHGRRDETSRDGGKWAAPRVVRRSTAEDTPRAARLT
jgi:hypothetical protein